jgi:hypothetical protein
MVLSSQNSGKYLTKTWQKERNSALMDSTKYTAAELAYLEVDATGGIDGQGQMIEDSYIMTTTPIDPLTSPRMIDLRTIPGYER